MVTRLPAHSLLDTATGAPIRFDRGVILGKNQGRVFGGVPNVVSLDPDDGSDADLWVSDPDPFDWTRRVVVVHERTIRRNSFVQWLRRDAQLPFDDVPEVIVYVPERAPGRADVASRLRECIGDAKIVSYYPPFAW